MVIKCAIVDDDNLFRGVLAHYLSKIDFLELTQQFSDAESALSSLDVSNTDLLFVDVEMPGKNGIEFLEGLSHPLPVIIVSRKKEYGVDAFDHNSIDYLLKPVSFPRFLQAAHKALKYFEDLRQDDTSRENLYIRQDRIWIRIPVGDIMYIRADDNDVIVKASDKTYKTHARLGNMYSQLPSRDFMQVHRSYVVNLQKVEKIDGEIIEVGARTIPVSKAHIKELHERLHII